MHAPTPVYLTARRDSAGIDGLSPEITQSRKIPLKGQEKREEYSFVTISLLLLNPLYSLLTYINSRHLYSGSYSDYPCHPLHRFVILRAKR